MITQKVKVVWIQNQPYLVNNCRPVINDIVAELLVNGDFDLFQIDNANDIDTDTQFPIVAKPEEIGYHWIKGKVMHDHVIDFYNHGTIEDIYDINGTLSKIKECKIIMDSQNDIMKIHNKVVIIL